MTAAPSKPVASIRWLAAPSSSLWLEQAISRPDEVLIDHAHCERKAAGAALQLMFRYPSSETLAEALSPQPLHRVQLSLTAGTKLGGRWIFDALEISNSQSLAVIPLSSAQVYKFVNCGTR